MSEIASLLLRGMTGGTMVAHGVRHLRTLEGTAGWFDSIGFTHARTQAQLSSYLEIGSGAALIAGAATPLTASSIVGTMAVAYVTVHRPNGFFTMNDGWEHVGLLAASSVAVSAIGPGRWSVDRLLGLDRKGTPLARAALTAGLGLAGAAVQLATFWRPARRPAG